MIPLLLALYPEAWRETYGPEFTALLEQSHLRLSVVFDVVGQAIQLRAKAHIGSVLFVAAGTTSMCVEILAGATGISANALWAPTTPTRGLALIALCAPWFALVIRATRNRTRCESAS